MRERCQVGLHNLSPMLNFLIFNSQGKNESTAMRID
jgi:hypothetical protein